MHLAAKASDMGVGGDQKGAKNSENKPIFIKVTSNMTPNERYSVLGGCACRQHANFSQ